MSRIGRAVVGSLLALAGVGGMAGPARADAAAACEVAYRPAYFTGGFTAAITIRNLGSETIDGWTFSFPLDAGATIAEVWNAELVAADTVVTTRDRGWNAVVPPGHSANIGFRAAGTAGDPAWFTVNGLTCRTAA